MMQHDFYHNLLKRLIENGAINKSNSVLVVCGGIADKEVLADFGFSHVTISNLDERMSGDKFKPYDWSFQDAEKLHYEDEEFEFVFVRAGLHHCRSPHKALCEMYRVAKRGILVIEARDSILARFSCFLHMTEEYELSGVLDENRTHGGLRNSGIPNYVYRWTERDISKTLQSYAPHVEHHLRFYYSLRIPYKRFLWSEQFFLRGLITLLSPLLRLITLIFRRQCNEFAALIMKPDLGERLQPWLEQTDNKSIIFKKTFS